MAAVSTNSSEKPQVKLIVAGVAAIAAISLMIDIGYHDLAQRGPSLSQELQLNKHPIPAWIITDAQQCQGNISSLSPQEQQKIEAIYPGQGGKIIVAAAYAQNH